MWPALKKDTSYRTAGHGPEAYVGWRQTASLAGYCKSLFEKHPWSKAVETWSKTQFKSWYVCVCVCIHACGGQGWLPGVFLHRSTWGSRSHWTWSSQTWLVLLVSNGPAWRERSWGQNKFITIWSCLDPFSEIWHSIPLYPGKMLYQVPI